MCILGLHSSPWLVMSTWRPLPQWQKASVVRTFKRFFLTPSWHPSMNSLTAMTPRRPIKCLLLVMNSSGTLLQGRGRRFQKPRSRGLIQYTATSWIRRSPSLHRFAALRLSWSYLLQSYPSCKCPSQWSNQNAVIGKPTCSTLLLAVRGLFLLYK